MSQGEDSPSAAPGVGALPQRLQWLLPIGVFLVAAGLFALRGHEGELIRDDSVYLYSGQQLARGVPPYLSTFDAKTPMAPILCGVGALLGDALGVESVLAVRVFFLGLSALCAVALYLLALELLRSRWAGVIAALVFVGFWGFGTHALSGPRAKTPMVLFEILCLLFAARRSWGLATGFGWLAFWTWQPAGLFPAAATAVALLGAGGGPEFWRRLRLCALGAAVPLAGILLLFLALGGLRELVQDAFVFNFGFLERTSAPWAQKLWKPFSVIGRAYTRMQVPIWLGLASVFALYPWRLSKHDWSPRRWLAHDPFALLLVTYPIPFLWSFKDFQDYPDFFIFLPYVALGFAALVGLVLQRLPQRAQHSLLLTLALGLVGASADQYWSQRSYELREQREHATQVAALAGPDSRIVSIGAPQSLVLLRKTNPNPYIFLCCGIEKWIAAGRPSGLGGWLRQITDARPDAIVVGAKARWLLKPYRGFPGQPYRPTQVGSWTVYSRSRDAGGD
jgi:hypothetical protein